MSNDWYWGGILLLKKTYSTNPKFLGIFEQKQYKELIKRKKTIPITTKTNFYYIREDQSNIIIDFNKEED
ncbi:hypothetical protein ETU08_04890 [Apibacter muscae]|uniref:hypothetical protein n=1 Tax=Apibacter muscae TaxID=2509004 RepID=UPI0011AC111A|nr:hypothetical protein [Apibacter muscae]TWP30435.1 hypothetical protein ETU08_04890 [Apibacter muscae]